MRAITLFLLISTVIFPGCAQEKELLIPDKATFQQNSAKPLYQKYGNVSAVKVVYHLKRKKLYLINANHFNFHYEFCRVRFERDLLLPEFNKINYSKGKDRKYLLGNINYYKSLDEYVLELGPSDEMEEEYLLLLYNQIKQNSFFGEKLLFLTNTSNAISLASKLKEIPKISPDEIYAGQNYQPIYKTKCKGRLRVINNLEEEYSSIESTDILILNETPLQLPIAKGIIVNQFQTPLSHVSILGKNRNIPVCAYKDIYQSSYIQLNGSNVEFVVEQDTFYIKKINEELNSGYTSKRSISIKYNLEVDALITLNTYNKKFKHAIGSKAVNFSKLVEYGKDFNFKTPESAFAIPFYFYAEHVKLSKSKNLILKLISDEKLSKTEKITLLDSIQKRIKEYPVSPKLLTAIENKIKALGSFTRMRFRSSTNAEDLPKFSGAGLYTSKTGEINNPKKPIEDAVRKVWASTWSVEAFFERELYKINQEDVKMGILVHRSFPNEAINGVAITKNLYRDAYLGFVLNSQLGDEPVVQQNKNIITEQLLIYPGESKQYYSTKNGYDVITYSSLNKNTLLYSNLELERIANTLEKIKQQYYKDHFIRKMYLDFGLDIEFKLAENSRELYIKQMREY